MTIEPVVATPAPVPPVSLPPPSNPVPITERVRQRVRQWVATTGVRQVVLARQIDKNQAWLSRYLAGEVEADLITIERLAQAFGHTLLALLEVPADPAEAHVIEMLRALPPGPRRNAVRLLEDLIRLAQPRGRRPK